MAYLVFITGLFTQFPLIQDGRIPVKTTLHQFIYLGD